MIVFLIAGQKKPYEGAVRPFCNFAKGLSEEAEVSFALFNCGRELVKYIETNFDAPIIISNYQNKLIAEIVKLNPQFIIGDDDLSRLRLLNAIKREIRNVKVAVYVQILYGSHAICRSFDIRFLPPREKCYFTLSKFVPFFILTRRYVAELERCDFIIANSKSTATFLQTLYGAEIHGIVYPPIDMESFKPILSNKDSKDVMLYLGSHGGDTPLDFTEVIVKNVLRRGYTINMFGNANIALTIKSKYPGTIYYKNLSDRELAELYSRSRITICPQRWEMFGYVEVESMACGTPVVAFNCMGVQETVIDGKTGWLAKNRREFLKMLDFILRNKEIQMDRDFIRRHVEENFSINTSVRKLEEVLKVIVDDQEKYLR